MTTQDSLDKWDHRAEWALAAVALVFLGAYSVEVLVQPRGLAQHAVNLVTFVAWAVFAVDYVARLYLAPDRRTWFFRHLVDLAVVLLPLLRPLRLLRLVVLVTALQKAVGTAIRGRVVLYTVAAMLMIGGISLVGSITATIASWVIQSVSTEDKAHAAVTATQIEDLRGEITRLHELLKQKSE